MKNEIVDIIKAYENECNKNKITPKHILQSELFNAIIGKAKECINELYKEGVVEVVETINQKAFKVK